MGQLTTDAEVEFIVFCIENVALEFFYQSFTYQEMSTGISYMHCRSDKYLAEELWNEYRGIK